MTDVVTSTISVFDSAPAQANFGTPLILAYHTNFYGVREYDADPSGLVALAADGFSETSAAYRKASAICAQTPHCSTFKIGTRASPNAQVLELTPLWTTVGRTISLTVDCAGTSTEVSYAPVAGDTAADICAELVSAIHALAGVWAVDGATKVIVGPDSLDERVYLKAVVGLAVADVSANAVGSPQALTLMPDAPDGEGIVYSCTIVYAGTATAISYTSLITDDQNKVTIALEDLIEAVTGIDSEVVEGTGDTDYVDVAQTADDPLTPIYIVNVSDTLTLANTSPTAGIAADLTTAAAEDDAWYGLLIDSESPAEIAAAAASGIMATRIGLALSHDEDNATASDGVAYTIHGTSNQRFAVQVTRDSVGCLDAALMGRQFSQNPGSSTWFGKTLTGPTADAWASGEKANILANGGSIYTIEMGISFTKNGQACGGRFLDVTRGLDWLDYEIKAALLSAILNTEKLGFVDVDAAVLEAALRGVLSAAEGRKLLAPGWSVTRPAVSAVSQANRALRIFPDLKWSAVLQGAIQSVLVSGTVTA